VAVEVGPTLPAAGGDDDGVGFEAIGIVSLAFPLATTHLNAGGGMTRSGAALGLWGLIAELPVGRGFRAATGAHRRSGVAEPPGAPPAPRRHLGGVVHAARARHGHPMGSQRRRRRLAVVAGLTMDVGL
jgi:hypothetical protein